MRAPLCVHCTSHDRRACEGVRRFATITASCSCGCHFVPQAGGAVVLVSADALAAAEVDRDAQRTRAEAAEAEATSARQMMSLADQERDDAIHRASAAEAEVARLRAVAKAADELVCCDGHAEVESYRETAPGSHAAAQVAAEAAYNALVRAVDAMREAASARPA